MRSSDKWIFYPMVDSSGGDYVKPDTDRPYQHQNKNLDMLKKYAEANPDIIAFNSNGWMKTQLRPESEWRKWTTNPKLGLYVKK